MNRKALETIAWAPYETISNPTREDWRKSYDALAELAERYPKDGRYPNTLGYLCYYGRHTGQRDYAEARRWFEKGHALMMIESTYKLADMMTDGLGGPVDRDKAFRLYLQMYLYCRNEFEGGRKDSKFADTALRMGRVFHDGKITKRNDLEALGYLLEAKYAIDWRKQYDEYGDDTVEKNILRLIGECDKPSEEEQRCGQYGIRLGSMQERLIPFDDDRMSMGIDVDDNGVARLEFRRLRKDGKKPNRILWSVAPAMKCFMTDVVVLYGADIRRIWNKKPGEPVICDWLEYDGETETWLFMLEDEVQCRLQGGRYVLPMVEFWKAEIRKADSTGTAAGPQ